MSPSPLPIARASTHSVDVRRILRRHRVFMFLAAAGLSGLIAEEAWAASQFWSHRPASEQIALGVAAVLVTFLGNAAALIYPALTTDPKNFLRPVGAFASAAFVGAALMAVTQAIVLILLLNLVAFDLVATYNLLKDVYFYTLVGAILFHGLLYYVRHMHWLYDKFGGTDSPLKPIAASGGLGAIILLVTLVFLPLDLQSITAAPAALRGLVGLHVYGRDIYLFTLAFSAYAWHLRWLADH